MDKKIIALNMTCILVYTHYIPAPGLGDERTATSPSLNVHLQSFVGKIITSYHPNTYVQNNRRLMGR